MTDDLMSDKNMYKITNKKKMLFLIKYVSAVV